MAIKEVTLIFLVVVPLSWCMCYFPPLKKSYSYLIITFGIALEFISFFFDRSLPVCIIHNYWDEFILRSK